MKKIAALKYIFPVVVVLALLTFGVALAETDSPDCHTGITIIKQTTPDGGAGFQFTALRNGASWDSFTLNDDGSKVYTNVSNGKTYRFRETGMPGGWSLTNVHCTVTKPGGTPSMTITYLADGVEFYLKDYHYVTCTFTNELADMDYGDLPETTPHNYAMTSYTNNGARHLPGDLFLGLKVDKEGDGSPDSLASGDNNNDQDDEDGLVPINVAGGTLWWSQGTGRVQVTVSGPQGSSGCLMGWLDVWNSTGAGGAGDVGTDGDFDDFGAGWSETIIQNALLPAGPGGVVTTLSFPLPLDAATYPTYARFRLVPTINGSCTPPGPQAEDAVGNIIGYRGFANNGEVEDYRWGWDPATAVTLQGFSADLADSTSITMLLVLVLSLGVLTILWRILRKAQG